jgi:hypothetical protein
MEASELEENQEVRVYERSHSTARNLGTSGRVLKVGRTLVTIRYGGSIEQFRIDSQKLNDKIYGNRVYFRTLPQAVLDERRDAATGALNGYGIDFRTSVAAKPLEQLEALAGLIRAFDAIDSSTGKAIGEAIMKKHVREAATPMEDGALVADCSCGGSYSVPQGGDEYGALEAEHARHALIAMAYQHALGVLI